MDRIILERLETGDQGTFGRIRIGEVIFHTLELPWRDNQDNISCIPAGVYNCKMTLSRRFKKRMYLVQGVNERDGIRIHSSNLAGDKTLGWKSQLSGCIALGEKRGTIEGQSAILLSTVAMRKFEKIMNEQDFILEIINGI